MAVIKIVDDDKEFALIIAEILKKDGHSVIIQNSTEHVIATLAEEKPDLLILDVMFPENPVGGFELARKVRQKKSMCNIPIILLTSINQEFPMDFSSKDVDATWMPVQEFLEKPIKAAKLLKTVNNLLKKKK